MMSRTALISLIVMALGSAPALALDAPLSPWDAGSERAERIEALVADPSLSGLDLTAAMGSADWRVRQQAAVIHGWRAYPDLYATVAQLEAAPTRTGMLRFRGSALGDARLTPLFLERLLQEPEPAYQQALIDVIPRTGGDWGQAYVALARQEQDPEVRAVLIASLSRAPQAPALEGLRLGLADSSARVRGEAARAAGWSDVGDQLIAELMGALDNDDAYVRANAARSLGTTRAVAAFEQLLPLVHDEDAEVRLRALRSLSRIDLDTLRARPELGQLESDPDPRVSRAARSLR